MAEQNNNNQENTGTEGIDFSAFDTEPTSQGSTFVNPPLTEEIDFSAFEEEDGKPIDFSSFEDLSGQDVPTTNVNGEFNTDNSDITSPTDINSELLLRPSTFTTNIESTYTKSDILDSFQFDVGEDIMSLEEFEKLADEQKLNMMKADRDKKLQQVNKVLIGENKEPITDSIYSPAKPIDSQIVLYNENALLAPIDVFRDVRIPTSDEWEQLSEKQQDLFIESFNIQQERFQSYINSNESFLKIQNEQDREEKLRAKGFIGEFLYGVKKGVGSENLAKDDTAFIIENHGTAGFVGFWESAYQDNIKLKQTEAIELLSLEGMGNMIGGNGKAMLKAGGAGMIGSILLTPAVGTGIGAAVGALDAAETGFGASFRQAYFQARANKMKPEKAAEVAMNMAITGAAAGFVEGGLGAVMQAKGLTKFLSSSKFSNFIINNSGKYVKAAQKTVVKGSELIAEGLADGGTSSVLQGLQNVVATNQDIPTGFFDGMGEAFAGEVLFSSGITVSRSVSGRVVNWLDSASQEDKMKFAKAALRLRAKARSENLDIVKKEFTSKLSEVEKKEADADINTFLLKKKKELEDRTTDGLTSPAEKKIAEEDLAEVNHIIDKGRIVETTITKRQGVTSKQKFTAATDKQYGELVILDENGDSKRVTVSKAEFEGTETLTDEQRLQFIADIDKKKAEVAEEAEVSAEIEAEEAAKTAPIIEESNLDLPEGAESENLEGTDKVSITFNSIDDVPESLRDDIASTEEVEVDGVTQTKVKVITDVVKAEDSIGVVKPKRRFVLRPEGITTESVEDTQLDSDVIPDQEAGVGDATDKIINSKPAFNNISERVSNNEDIDDKDIDKAIDEGIDLLDDIENSEDLTDEQKQELSEIISDEIEKFENYDVTAEDTTSKTTEETEVRGIRKTTREPTVKRKKDDPLKRLVGREIESPSKTEGTAKQVVEQRKDGSLALQEFSEDGTRLNSQNLVDKEGNIITNANQLEFVESIKDNDGNVTGVKLKAGNTEFTVVDSELAIDLGAKQMEAQIGDVDRDTFESFVSDARDRAAQEDDTTQSEQVIDEDAQLEEDIAEEERQKAETLEQIQKAQLKRLADKIRSKKVDTKNTAFLMPDLGITVAIYNKAMDIVADNVERGTKLGNAVKKGVEFINKNTDNKKWNRGEFFKRANLKFKAVVNGKEVDAIEDNSKEATDIINGFYSPLEESLNEIKGDNHKGSFWAKEINKRTNKGEVLFTGLQDFLFQEKDRKVTKKEIRDFLKENRIKVAEVVLTDSEFFNTDSRFANVVSKNALDRTILEIAKKGKSKDKFIRSLSDFVIERASSLDETIQQVNDLFPNEFTDAQIKNGDWIKIIADDLYKLNVIGEARHTSYQLLGDSRNYRELLLLIPEIKSPIIKAFEKELWERGYYSEGRYRKDIYTRDSHKDVHEVSRTISDEDFEFFKKYRKALEKDRASLPSTSFVNNQHFNQYNSIVHLRLSDRGDNLLAEEFQSDFGQTIREKGFKLTGKVKESDFTTKEVNDFLVIEENETVLGTKYSIVGKYSKNSPFLKEKPIDNLPLSSDRLFDSRQEAEQRLKLMNEQQGGTLTLAYLDGEVVGVGRNDKEAREIALNKYESAKINSKFNAPFVRKTGDWTRLAIKLALKEAVRSGKKKLIWTSGEDQNERWSFGMLSSAEAKHVRNSNGEITVTLRGRDGDVIATYNVNNEKALAEHVGKQFASTVFSDLALYERDADKIKELLAESERLANESAENDVMSNNASDNDRFVEADRLAVLSSEQLNESIRLKAEADDIGRDNVIYADEDLNFSKDDLTPFYGSRETGDVGTVGNVVKNVVKELTGEEGELIDVKLDVSSTKSVMVDIDGDIFSDTNIIGGGSGSQFFVEGDDGSGESIIGGGFNTREEAQAFIDNNIAEGFDGSAETTLKGVEITPKLKESIEGGIPLFKNMRNAANKIRRIKAPKDLAFSTIPLLVPAWNTAVETVAKAVEIAAKVGDASFRLSEAVEVGLQVLKESDGWKKLTPAEKARISKAFRDAFKGIVNNSTLLSKGSSTVKSLLSATIPSNFKKTSNGRSVGTINDHERKVLTKFNESLKSGKINNLANELTELEKRFDELDSVEDADELDEVIGEIEGVTLALQALTGDESARNQVANEIDALKMNGKSKLKEKLNQLKQFYENLQAGTVEAVTGGTELLTGLSLKNLMDERSKGWNNFFEKVEGLLDLHEKFKTLIDKIDRGDWVEEDRRTGFGGFLNKNFMPMLLDAADKRDKLRREFFEEVDNKLAEIYGIADNTGLLNKQILAKGVGGFSKRERNVRAILERNNAIQFLGEFTLSNGKKEKMNLSQNQMAYIYSLMKNPELRQEFKDNMNWTEEMLNTITKELDPKVKEFNDWIVDTIYPAMHALVNDTHKEVNHISLGKRENYVPIRREMFGKEPVQMSMNQYANNSVAVQYSFLQQAKGSKAAFNVATSSIDVLSQYIVEMSHYVGYAKPIKTINSVFLNNASVRKAILQTNPQKTLDVLDDSISRIANQGNKEKDLIGIANLLKKYTTISNLALSLPLFIKQLTSAPAGIGYVGFSDFFKNFPSAFNKAEVQSVIDGSEFLTDRFGKNINIDKDIVSAASKDFLSYSTSDYDRLLSATMFNIKWGDRGGILLGFAVYKSSFNHYMKQLGNTANAEDIARKKATRDFEEYVRDTQQSSAEMDKSYIETRGFFVNLYTMFKSAPFAMLRQERKGFRDIARGYKTGNKHQKRNGINRVIVNHLLLPAIFSAVSAGLDDEDDNVAESVISSMIIGSLYPIFILGDYARHILNVSLGKPWATKKDGFKTPAFVKMDAITFDIGQIIETYLKDVPEDVSEKFSTDEELEMLKGNPEITRQAYQMELMTDMLDQLAVPETLSEPIIGDFSVEERVKIGLLKEGKLSGMDVFLRWTQEDRDGFLGRKTNKVE